ncbi:hypothetical protein MRX96_047313 [Rhipicephalus microplus]
MRRVLSQFPLFDSRFSSSKGSYGNWYLIVLIIAILIASVALTIFAAVTLSRHASGSGTDDYYDEALGDGPGGGGKRKGGVSTTTAADVEDVTHTLPTDASSDAPIGKKPVVEADTMPSTTAVLQLPY